MEIRHSIRFLLNGSPLELFDIPPTLTVLDYLRLDRALRGTKEGCAEGDCGRLHGSDRAAQGRRRARL